jgi:mannose-6-phosphate isomerase-like protein (cupin superfamily)
MKSPQTNGKTGSTEVKLPKIGNLLRRRQCVVLKGFGCQWRGRSSKVISSPIIQILRAFNSSSEMEAAFTFVSISRKDDRPHYHGSHLIAMIVSGRGSLCIGRKGRRQIRKIPVAVNDLLVIPRGSFHMLDCGSSGKLDFIALELSDPANGDRIIVGPDSIKE